MKWHQPFERSVYSALACSVLALGLTVSTASAQQAVSGAKAEAVSRWFVELTNAPVADGGDLKAGRAEKDAFRKAARDAGVRFKERRSFDTLFNGVSISVVSSDLGKLSRIDGVKALYPVVTERLPPGGNDSSPDMSTALAMTGADVAQNSLRLTGAGVRVAIIDSGIDFDHPDFGGNGVPGDGINPDPNFGRYGNSRVRYGYDFVGDAYDAGGTTAAELTPVPDANPDSCRDFNGDAGSHGTHVAGIVGASGTPPSGVRGVAPGVTFGAYRVFGCNGSTDTDIMLAAMERALDDRMDVINMSIGSSYQWPQYPTAEAASRLVKKGVVVVASIGNSGGVANNGWSAGAPGTGANVIGVASFDNTYEHQAALAVNGVNYGYNTGAGAPPPPSSGSFPLGRVGDKTSTAAGCAALPAGSLTGQIALIRRGGCTFYIKALNAMNAGAAGVALYNNVAGSLSPTVAGTPAITIPVVMLSNTDGNAIDDLLAGGLQNMAWTGLTVDKPQATAGLISGFSSWGLAADLSLKPDIGAPGGSIRSTYPLEYGSYASISGTSMSSPHVAGGVALLLQAKPKTRATDVRDILQNSAIPSLWSAAPNYGILDATHRQGAGMLNIPGAVQATTRVEPGKLSLGESQFGPAKRSLMITNSNSTPETYDLSFEDAIATTGSYILDFWLGTSSVVFSQRGAPVTSITVQGRATARLDVSIAPDPDNNNLDDLSQYGGYITLAPRGSSNIVTVPVAGFKGDYQALQVLTPVYAAPYGFPWLATTTDGELFDPELAGATYTMVGFDQPNIAAHFDHQSSKVRFDVYDTSGKYWNRAFPDFDYFGMNPTSSGFFAFAWDGTTIRGDSRDRRRDDKKDPRTFTVPNGTYVIKLSVLRALGDERNPAHWETWTSPVITVARP